MAAKAIVVTEMCYTKTNHEDEKLIGAVPVRKERTKPMGIERYTTKEHES